MQINLKSSRRARLTSAVIITALALSLFGSVRLTDIFMPTAHADTTYFNLASGNLTQDWSNVGLITTADDWSGVPSITGYLGDDAGAGTPNSATAVDPSTIVGSVGGDRSVTVNVFANRADPNTTTNGGTIEFDAIPNPVVALNGSGTADFPNLVIFLNTTGRTGINISYNVRDVDASMDDAMQQLQLQYRVGTTGDFINVVGTNTDIADATTAGTATQVTAVSATLPTAAENQAQVQVRIISSNAAGNDEAIGIDDINVTSSPMGGGGTPPITDSQTVYAVTTGNTLISFNTTTPGTVNMVGTISGITGTIIGIDFRPSGNSTTREQLYAVTNDGGTGRIYVINLQTAAATLRATLAPDTVNDTTPDYAGLTGTNFGVDFNPVPDRLRVVSDTGQNLRINVDTGATITDGAINPGTPSISAVAYTNPDNNSATGTTLYDISATSDELFIQNPPNNGTVAVVGPLGVDATAVNGFDITRSVGGGSGTGNAFAVLNVGGTPNIYQINLATGAATSGGAVNTGGGGVIGIAIADVAGGTITDSQLIYGVTAGNRLVSFNTTMPGTVTDIAAITGITGTIIGIDFRPSSSSTSGTRRLLYAVTNDGGTGRIYTIDLQTGAATLRATLTADTVNDTTPDYTGLTGTIFGVDFNPVPDRLRVVSNTGQNLRINVDTGATITDGTINPGTPSIVAVGYTNPDSDAATGTTLYDIDTASDTLFIQNPPNNGTLATVGPLGVDVSNASFDIGRASSTDVTRSGNAFAVLTVGGVQNLYEIVLGSGRAILGGAVNSASALTGIAIADLSPTADTVTIAGRVTTPDSTPLSGVSLRLSGSQQAVVLTDDDGSYVFDSIEAGGIYTISASYRGYRFASSQRTFADVQANTVADFVASPIKGRTSRSIYSRSK